MRASRPGKNGDLISPSHRPSIREGRKDEGHAHLSCSTEENEFLPAEEERSANVCIQRSLTQLYISTLPGRIQHPRGPARSNARERDALRQHLDARHTDAP